MSSDEILKNETNRGIQDEQSEESRKDLLDNHLHVVLRIIKGTPFTAAEKLYFRQGFDQDIFVSKGGKSLKRSLYFEEAGIPGENIVQFFIAFQNTPGERDIVQMTLSAQEINLTDKSISIPFKCFL